MRSIATVTSSRVVFPAEPTTIPNIGFRPPLSHGIATGQTEPVYLEEREVMKRFFLCSLCAALFAGCAEPVDSPSAETQAAAAETSQATDETHAHDGDIVSAVDGPGLTKVLAENNVTLIDFTATWCGPCQQLKPELHELAEEMKGKAKFVEVDVDKNQEVASKYEIEAMPTLVILKGNEVHKRVTGYLPGSTIDELRNALQAAQ